MNLQKLGIASIALFCLNSGFVQAATEYETDFTAELGLEGRYFYEDAADPRQPDATGAAYLLLDMYLEWGTDQRFTLQPFGRWDSSDDERNHFDLREANYSYFGRDWELLIGVSKVFWGVTEFNHLIDIVNQTDAVENPDGEDKLGQQMIKVTWLPSFGTLNFFVLPGFRERTFAGVEGRLRPPLVVDTDNPLFESDQGTSHIDGAFRYYNSFGSLDLGLSWFGGTSRDPRLLLDGNVVVLGGQPFFVPTRFIPFYEQINQYSIDAQYVWEALALKLEAFYREDALEEFHALVAGFEYSFAAIFETNADLGLIVEYMMDDREFGPVLQQDDIAFGTRWAFNDVASTEILGGVIIDLENDAVLGSIEAARRFGDSTKVSLEVRVFENFPANDPLGFIAQDDFVQLEIIQYF